MKRNKFSLSHYKLLTGDMGNLIPLTWYEALPGDTIQQSTSMLLRVSPLLAPVMHPVRIRIHHIFVPLRHIWDESGGADTGFEAFITGGPDGTSTPTHPYVTLNGTVSEGDLWEYLGIPPNDYSAHNLNVSALPLRAYALIFNEYYRDQDLVTELTIDKSDGQDTTTNTTLQKVAWEKDYFTAARPWTQKGSEVTIPLTGDIPVVTDAAHNVTLGIYDRNLSSWRRMNAAVSNLAHDTGGGPGTDGELYADGASAGGVDINELRLSLALQRYKEARAQYGSRYVEYLRYLGVRSSDARLQRPEYLGGGKQIVSFSEVLSTDGANTGSLKGHGIAALRSNRYRRFFEEHGIVMSLLSVLPKAMYTQGVHKKFLRTTKEDYFQKELQNIGEQEIVNNELYVDHTNPTNTFGYTPRYDEYRSMPSSIAGEFHSTNDHWYYARVFGSDPSLNSTFVSATPTKRVNASSSTDCMYIMANHSIQARRMMPKYARPRIF